MKLHSVYFGLFFGLLIMAGGVSSQAAPPTAASGPGTADTAVQPSGKIIPLGECLKLSVANSPQLKVAGLEQIRLHYNYKATAGTGLPQVSLSGSYDDYVSSPVTMIPDLFSTPPNLNHLIPVHFMPQFSITGGLDASQVLYNQSWLSAMKLARQMEQQNELATEKTRIEVVYQVAQSYCLAQITREQVKNMESNLEKIVKAEKIAASQYEYGIIKKIDLDRIVVQKNNMITEIDRLKVNYLQELAMLKYFMGIGQDEEIRPADSISAVNLSPGGENDLRDHIDIRMIGKQKDLVNANIRLNQAEYYPNLTLIGSSSYMTQNNTMYLFGKSNEWYNTSLVGLRLSVPVFSGMQKHYKVSQSRVELEKLKVNEEDTKRLLRINSEDAARKLLNSVEAEKRQRENVGLAERVYGVSQEQYQKGMVPLTDLLNTETALSDAQANHIYALVQMKISELDYLRANGKLLDILK